MGLLFYLDQPRKRTLLRKALEMLLCAGTFSTLQAQSFIALANFNGVEGSSPRGGLIQGLDGNLYGTSSAGADSACGQGCGTIFKVTTAGAVTTLHKFKGTDGWNAQGALVLGTDGNFYGCTAFGGASGVFGSSGTAFKITPQGDLTTLHNFDFTDGFYPTTLVQAYNGDFYGTTAYGGALGRGTIFQLTAAGTLTTLHSLTFTNGYFPLDGLVQGPAGELYGTAAGGGAHNDGTVFKITIAGSFARLHSFALADGFNPEGALVEGADGNLYGTTMQGGSMGLGTIFRISPGPGATLTTLDGFSGANGAQPLAAMVLATDGSFYGTTTQGGSSTTCFMGCGTIFKVTAAGILTTLHSFDLTEGYYPGKLLQATNGKLYGTTAIGGPTGNGTVFSFDVGLGPFVKTLPTSGKAGAHILILGTNLTGTTSVTFDGTPAAFTILSPTEIITTVPAGAAIGRVKVVTPGGALASNAAFRVTT